MTAARSFLGRHTGPALGIAAVVGAWWLLSVTFLGGGDILPTPGALIGQLWHDRGLYPTHVEATGWEAIRGYIYGNALAIGLAVLFFGVPVMEKVLLQIGVASYCLPIIAIGPVLATVFEGDAPQQALAGISVFLTTLVSTLLGLRAADTTALDLVRAYGGGAVRQMRFVRLRSALPSVFTGLKIAAPAAVLGALIGEWMGADRGIGVAMVNSEQAAEVARTYGYAVVVAALTGVWYALTTLAGRLVSPWAPREEGMAGR